MDELVDVFGFPKASITPVVKDSLGIKVLCDKGRPLTEQRLIGNKE